MPLLFVAAYSGNGRAWQILVTEVAKLGQLEETLKEDVDGWTLVPAICLSNRMSQLETDVSADTKCKKSLCFLKALLVMLGDDALRRWIEAAGPLLTKVLLHHGDVHPMKLLL